MEITIMWASQHEPTLDQRESLRGHRIVMVDQRFNSAEQLLSIASGIGADVIMAVLPLPMLAQLVSMSKVPVIRAIMEWKTDENGRRTEIYWTGRWERVKEIRLITDQWNPPTPPVYTYESVVAELAKRFSAPRELVEKALLDLHFAIKQGDTIVLNDWANMQVFPDEYGITFNDVAEFVQEYLAEEEAFRGTEIVLPDDDELEEI